MNNDRTSLIQQVRSLRHFIFNHAWTVALYLFLKCSECCPAVFENGKSEASLLDTHVCKHNLADPIADPIAASLLLVTYKANGVCFCFVYEAQVNKKWTEEVKPRGLVQD